jgi:opacity protein-like surface antigen
MRNALALGALACLVWTVQASAQDGSGAPWRWSARLSAALPLGKTDWSISHPTYSGAGVTWETFRGTFRQRVQLQASLELRRAHIGIRGMLGLLPQEFTQESPVQHKDFRLLLAGLSAVLYPTPGSGGRLDPYVAAGVGGLKALGDMDNTGFFLTGAAGVRIGLTPRVALDGGVQVQRLKYTQIGLTSTIAKDVRTNPASVFLGAGIGL